ncbi:MAG: hypothetical protein HND53_02135 [Proteobacteria bacterium]|nr:hypothetical protein [Pseudomonadota bacterium]
MPIDLLLWQLDNEFMESEHHQTVLKSVIRNGYDYRFEFNGLSFRPVAHRLPVKKSFMSMMNLSQLNVPCLP